MRPIDARQLIPGLSRVFQLVALALLLGACCFWPFPVWDEGHGHGGHGGGEGGERHEGGEGHGGHGGHEGH